MADLDLVRRAGSRLDLGISPIVDREKPSLNLSPAGTREIVSDTPSFFGTREVGPDASELERARSTFLGRFSLAANRFGSGFHGRVPREERLAQLDQQERRIDLAERRAAIEEFGAALGTMQAAQEFLDTQVPFSQQGEARKKLAEFIEENAPFEGLGETFSDFAVSGTPVPGLDETLALLPPTISAIYRDQPPARLREFQAQLLKSGELQRLQQRRIDEATIPALREQKDTILSIAQANGIDPSTLSPRRFIEEIEQHLPDRSENSLRDLVMNGQGTLIRNPELLGLLPDELVTAREKERFKAEFRQPQQSEAVNVVLPDGTARLGRERPDGRIELVDGQGRVTGFAPEGSTIAGIQGSRGDAGISIPEARGLRELEATARDFLDLSGRTVALIHGRPDIAGPAGETARLANELLATVDGFARLAGTTFEVGGQEVPASEFKNLVRSEVNGTFDDSFFDRVQVAGQDRAVLRSHLVGLAYAAAALSGQSGRAASDRDIRNFEKRVGSSADPETFVRVLQELEDEVVQKFETRFGIARRGNPELGETPDLRSLQSEPVRRDRSGRGAAPAPTAESQADAARTEGRAVPVSLDTIARMSSAELARLVETPGLEEDQAEAVRQRLKQLRKR